MLKSKYQWLRKNRVVGCLPRKSKPLTLEALEDRITPVVVQWTGDSVLASFGNDLWSNPANWSNNTVPTVGDQVVFPSSGFHQGTSKVDVAYSIGSLQLNWGGQLTASGQLTITDSMSWTGGGINGTGSIVNEVSSVMTFGSLSQLTLGVPLLQNKGTIHIDSSLSTDAATVIQNEANGVIDLRGDVSLAGIGFSSGGAIANAGTIRKSGGTDTAFMDLSLNNSGTLDVESGTLSLRRAGSGFGTFQAGGGTLLFASSSFTLDNGAVITGAGKTAIQSGVLTVSGDLTTDHFEMQGGDLVLQGAFTVMQTLDWFSGTIKGSGSLNLSSAAVMTVKSGGQPTLTVPVLHNQGAIRLQDSLPTGSASVIDNQQSGVIDVQGNFDMLGIGFNPGGTIHNSGILQKSGGSGTANILMVLTNSGLTTSRMGTLRIRSGGSGAGQFRADVGTVVSFFGLNYVLDSGGSFAGEGTVLLESGSITVAGDATADRLVMFGSADNPVLTGPGTLTITKAFDWNGGQLNGQGALKIDVDAVMTIDMPSQKLLRQRHLINAGTILTLAELSADEGAVIDNLAGGLIDVRADTSLGTRFNLSNGTSTINNAGTIRKSVSQGEGHIKSDFNNTGVVEVVAGGLSLEGAFANFSSASGTLTGGSYRIQGTLRFKDASIIHNSASILLDGSAASIVDQNDLNAVRNLGTNSSAGEIILDHGKGLTVASFTNAGKLTLNPSSVFTVNGEFTQLATGLIATTVAGAPESALFGQVVSIGSANLDGSASVALGNGFAPTIGQSYSIVSYSGHTGAFASIALPTNSGTSPFATRYTSEHLFLDTQTTPADLAIDNVNVQPTAISGANVSIDWKIKNVGGAAASGSWTDSVYLSSDSVLDASDQLVGRVLHTGDLAAGQTYQGTLMAPLPGVKEGQYHIIVLTDSRLEIADANRANNTGLATVDVGLMGLTPPDTIVGTIADGQSIYIRVTTPLGLEAMVNIAAQFGAAHEAELYFRHGDVPDRSTFDAMASDVDSDHSILSIDPSLPGPYYLLLYGNPSADAGKPFQLTVSIPRFDLQTVSPKHGSNEGTTTLTLHGSSFSSSTAVALVSSSGDSRSAVRVQVGGSDTLFATMDLRGLTPGTYDIKVQDIGGTATLPNAFTVNNGKVGHLLFHLDVTAQLRPGRTGNVTVDYFNVGETDVNAPLLFLEGTQAALEQRAGGVQTDFILLPTLDQNGPPGVVPPSARGTFSLLFVPTNPGANTVSSVALHEIIGNPNARPVSDPFNGSPAEPTGQPDQFGASIGFEGFKVAYFEPLGVLSNDSGGASPRHVAIFTRPQHGVVTLTGDGNGSFFYAAPKSFTGTDTFQYIVVDAEGHTSDPVTVTIDMPLNTTVDKVCSDFAEDQGQYALCKELATATAHQVTSDDPNDIIGPSGFGSEGFVSPDQTFDYTIHFENKPTATAPAQTVTISQQLDSDLDLSTFELGRFGFGDLAVEPPAGRQFFSTRVDARATRGVLVDVQAELNSSTGVVTWTFSSVDPQTLDIPSDVLAGFLPPNTSAPEGEGFVSYRIRPKSGADTGTSIDAKATVVFDTNAPLDTLAIFNTTDTGAPTSQVNQLPAVTNSREFTVTWSGADDSGGSGLAAFDVFVSDNNGPFFPLALGTTITTTNFTGEFGHKYAFFTVATDHVGLRQETPATGHASTQLVDPNPPIDSAARFVTALYRDVLGRAPDSAGLQFWANHLRDGASRDELAAGFWESAEHRGAQVDELYSRFLHRVADPNGRAFWISTFKNGSDENGVALGFLTSAEYSSSHASAEAFIGSLYTDVLSRASDSIGAAFWQNEVQQDGQRATVAASFLASREAHLKLVDRYYSDYLGRKFDTAGLQFWQGQLDNRTGTPTSVAERFLNGKEYLARAIE